MQVLIKLDLLFSVSWHKYLVREMERTPSVSHNLAEQDLTPFYLRRAGEVRGLRGIRIKAEEPWHLQVAEEQILL